jgi:hypothetical protein
MRRRFQRGQRIVAIIIVIMLLMNGVSLWLSQTVLLSWYHDALTAVGRVDSIQAAKSLEEFVLLNQRNLANGQAASYAFLIFCCIILYLGYGWIRWLWGISWLIKGVSGLVAASLFNLQFDVSPNLFYYGLITSLLYTLCALCILFSPSVHAYMQAMRQLPGKRIFLG